MRRAHCGAWLRRPGDGSRRCEIASSATIVTLPTKNDVSIMLKCSSLALHSLKSLRNVRLLHEAVAHHDGMEIVAQVRHLDAPLGRYARNVGGHDVQQHDALVQHLVVL